MIILLAGIQAIPNDLMEAADIDGATFWEKLFYITIPMVKPIILFCTITSTIGTLQLFDEPFILTEGGPNNATITMGQYLYNNGFRYLKFGYASAIGYVMTVIIGLLSVFQFKATKEERNNEKKNETNGGSGTCGSDDNIFGFDRVRWQKGCKGRREGNYRVVVGRSADAALGSGRGLPEGSS